MQQFMDELLTGIEPPSNPELERKIRLRLDSLTKPPGSLGRLESIALWYCMARGEVLPAPPRKRCFIFCADHGVTAAGVSPYPREVTRQMALNFALGGAAINVLCRQAGIEAVVVDVGVDGDIDPAAGVIDRKVARGTANLAEQPAMTADQCEKAILTGAALAHEAVDEGFTLLLGGEMGIGNTTAAAAVGAALLGRGGKDLAGRGAGIDDEGLSRKAALIDQALARADVDPTDALQVLTEFGGLEIAALCGMMLGAAARRTPVLVDGFIATAAALAAVRLAPAARGYLLFAHRSAEQGHRMLLESLEAAPVLDLDMRLGEGSGAALAATVVDRALSLYREMATFDSAGISGGD